MSFLFLYPPGGVLYENSYSPCKAQVSASRSLSLRFPLVAYLPVSSLHLPDTKGWEVVESLLVRGRHLGENQPVFRTLAMRGHILWV